MSDIQELQDFIMNFAETRGWRKFHSAKNLAMSIAIESAELMEHFQWIDGKVSDERLKENEEFKQEVADEMADVFIYLLALAKYSNIDLKKALLEKMNRNKDRFPEKKDYQY